MNTEKRLQKIELYGKGYDLLIETLKDVPLEIWQFKPAPAEWSIHEIIIHLADSEAIAAQQARLMVAEPGGTVMAYNPDAWASNLHYHEQDAEEALQLLRLTRAFTYRWFKNLPEKAFTLSAAYPGDEELYLLDDLLRIYAGHIPSHIEQIKNNVEVWKNK
ncbi:MAG: DinB family protein [Anaerolineales bacterium]|nr:DinB family protein [Anaerolineales bacterium]